jgi:hypothetical protein
MGKTSISRDKSGSLPTASAIERWDRRLKSNLQSQVETLTDES